ncbi:DUF1700 domain-containing protein [Candidatus Enterococcus ikei]|uniref:DUF1700 domain-containing protein n=1 Tax=Candidatus Enterococcus ikei TaxID=2815326 RepID=A0ABS3GU63_9ENTE|nr:DUF1700 domain-containing protein [Enterococcus sp. DIV0869a]MBO0438797.1 DUF1700 domain-containing protein [Enterococcus sp. DIV0869a]
MNKEHFLIELKIYLKPLTPQQQAFVLNKYETIFDERSAAGETEEEIAKSLGKPRSIAEEILQEFDIAIPEKKLERDGWQEIQPNVTNDYYYEEAPEHPYDDTYQTYERPRHSGFTRFCQVAGVLSLNFLLMIWFIFAFIMIFFACWLVAVVFLFSPILGGISVVAGFNDATMFQMFLSIFLCGAGVIGILILTPLTKFFGKVLRRYLQWNIQVLRGEI